MWEFIVTFVCTRSHPWFYWSKTSFPIWYYPRGSILNIEKYYDFYCLPTLILQSRYTPLRWLLQWKSADIEDLCKNILHREMRPVLHLLIEHTSSLDEACSTPFAAWSSRMKIQRKNPAFSLLKYSENVPGYFPRIVLNFSRGFFGQKKSNTRFPRKLGTPVRNPAEYFLIRK